MQEIKHKWWMEGPDRGYAACLNCGRWTRQGREVLETVECVKDWAEGTPLAYMKVKAPNTRTHRSVKG